MCSPDRYCSLLLLLLLLFLFSFCVSHFVIRGIMIFNPGEVFRRLAEKGPGAGYHLKAGMTRNISLFVI